MFRINLKFAFRNLLRFKTYSILNIIGLAIGLALGIFVILYINYGFGYDRIHTNGAKMYKLLTFIKQADNKSFTDYRQSVILGDALKQEASEIESYNRTADIYLFFKKEDSPIGESGIFADNNFFKFFSFPVIEGDPSTMLNEPGAIIISERLAQKLFGEKQAIGQMVSVLMNNKQVALKVNGVFKNIEHSTMYFEFVLPFSMFLADNPNSNDFKIVNCQYMFTLKQGADIASINKKIKNFLHDKDLTSNKDLLMQPLWEVYLYHYIDGNRQMGKLLIITIMSIIGGLILLISAFNFINMAIAVGVKRYRESAMKKILGSSRQYIILQFVTETIVICLIALFFAFIMLETFLPVYNRIDNLNLAINYLNPTQMLLFIGFAMLVGILASLYPAILLASASPIKIMKGVTGSHHRIGLSRQGLIVFQFFVSIILVVGLIVFNRQAKYIETKDVGLDRQNVLFFTATDDIMKHREAFHSELASLPEVTSISWNSQIPLRLFSSTTNVLWDGKQDSEKMDFWTLDTDSSFISTFKPWLQDGRFFSPVLASDSGTYIINEEAVRCMHLKDPIGKEITVNGHKGTVIGVVRNFNTLQLNVPYLPVVIRYRPQEANMVFLRYKGDQREIQKKVETAYKKYEAYIPVMFRTLEQAFRDLNRFADSAFLILSALSFLAIFLACAGLFGLASFTIETRTKEIGIRKANGASTFTIIRMFLRSYSKWIIIASCVGLPIGFLAWSSLLKSVFAFRIPFPIWSLAAAPIIVLIIAWGTVILQAWRAASKNPVDALRYE